MPGGSRLSSTPSGLPKPASVRIGRVGNPYSHRNDPLPLHPGAGHTDKEATIGSKSSRPRGPSTGCFQAGTSSSSAGCVSGVGHCRKAVGNTGHTPGSRSCARDSSTGLPGSRRCQRLRDVVLLDEQVNQVRWACPASACESRRLGSVIQLQTRIQQHLFPKLNTIVQCTKFDHQFPQLPITSFQSSPSMYSVRKRKT